MNDSLQQLVKNWLIKAGNDSLTIYGVEIRYPDDFYMPTREEADSSIQIALFAKEFISAKLL